MTANITIRESLDSDVGAITEIYRHHVLHGTGSFEIVPPDETEIRLRREKTVKAGCPWLVAELEGRVEGYAYAGLFHAREAYRYTLEDSIYVRQGSSGQGIGRLLLESLIEACRNGGFKKIVALIGDSRNIGSIRIHERCGFRHSGVLKEVGLKQDRWLDVVLMQLEL